MQSSKKAHYCQTVFAPDERTIIPKLFERKEKFDDPACTLGYPEMYIETEMTFVSGDRLIIACESIVM